MGTLAVIAARGGSKRLPGKNVRPFLDVPLIRWSIRFAQSLGRFDRIVMSTDNEEIAAESREAGLDVPYLRPANLATDTASSVDVVLGVLAREKSERRTYDYVALLQPTSPMRDQDRWVEAFDRIGSCDAVIGVAPVRSHPFHVFMTAGDGLLAPFTNAEGLGLRSQDLPPVVAVAGNMYLIRADVLEQQRTFFPAKTIGIVCDRPYEAVDIDTEDDWIVAEALGRRYGRAP